MDSSLYAVGITSQHGDFPMAAIGHSKLSLSVRVTNVRNTGEYLLGL